MTTTQHPYSDFRQNHLPVDVSTWVNVTALYVFRLSAAASAAKSTEAPMSALSSSTWAPYVSRLEGENVSLTKLISRTRKAHHSLKLSPKYPLCKTRTLSPGSTKFAETCYTYETVSACRRLQASPSTNLIPTECSRPSNQEDLSILSVQNLSASVLSTFPDAD